MPACVTTLFVPTAGAAGMLVVMAGCCIAGEGVEPGAGAVDNEAPTGISQRCPGVPCAGLGSLTPAVAGCTWTGFTGVDGVMTVSAAGAATLTSLAGSSAQAASSSVNVSAGTVIERGMCMRDKCPAG